MKFPRVLAVVDGSTPEELDPKKKLDSLMHLAELCIEVIQQNEEYHAEVSNTRLCHVLWAELVTRNKTV